MYTPAFPVLEILGILTFAASGISVARAAGLDAVGCYFCALLTSLGGGTVRDVLIAHRPFYWSSHEWLLPLILLLVLASYLPRLMPLFAPISVFVQLADSIGVGIFSMCGLTLALQYEYGPLSATLMAVVTAIVGGVLRDLVCGQVPYAFRRTELCATCTVAGCIMYFACQSIGAELLSPFLYGVVLAAAMRFMALRKNLKLPV